MSTFQFPMFVWVLVVFLVGGLFSERPQLDLESSHLWSVNNTVLNSLFVMGVATLNFDQELYINGPPTVCAFRDEVCPDVTCTPCDWAVQNPSSCGDPNCCGPSQWNASQEEVDEWCNPHHEYETLTVGTDSEFFEIEEEKWRYFRFFLPEEYYCRTIAISARTNYGFVSLIMSSQTPTPDFDVYDWQAGGPSPQIGLGVNLITLCPTAHPTYTLGTYAIGIYGITPASVRIDLEYADEIQPFPAPVDRLSCSDVPPEEFNRRAGSRGDPVVCLEDGVTERVTSNETGATGMLQMIVPLKEGCQKISFFGQALTKSVSFAVHCLNSDGDENTGYQNTLWSRFGARRDQAVSFNLCFEETTYLACALRFYEAGDVQAVFSTTAQTFMRKMVEIPHASLTYQDGLSAVTTGPFGSTIWPAGDFYVYVYNWITSPSTDPLVLYPANSNLRYYYHSSDLIQEYMDAGLATPLNKTLVHTFAMNVGNNRMITYNQSILSIGVLGITNKDGEPVLLPNNGVDLNPPSVPSYALPSRYIPHIAVDTLSPFDPSSYCDSEKYNKFQVLVQEKIDNLLDDSLSFNQILYNKYAIEVFNAGIAGSSCNSAVSGLLETEPTNITLLDQIACQTDITDLAVWSFEPCCNVYLEITTCCVPYNVNETVELFNDESGDVEDCGVPDCAASYLEEVAFAFDHGEDPILGCTSGIQEYLLELTAREFADYDVYLVPCLIESGFGDRFDGNTCVVDSDCDQWSGRCDFETGICVSLPIEEMEDRFLHCFINTMSSSLEEYIRLNAFPADFTESSDSPLFFEMLKQVASKTDCVNPHNPLDLSKRERYVYDADFPLCKADAIGLDASQLDLLDELCPPGLCLGDFCRQNNTNCRAQCKQLYSYVPINEANCAEDECILSNGACDDNFYCMYCSANGAGCTVAPGLDEGSCATSYACELPDGEVVFGLNEEECRNAGFGCSADCFGPSCQSFSNVEGACAFESSDEASCENWGSDNGWDVIFDDPLCIITSEDMTQSQCLAFQVPQPTIEWYTCPSFGLDVCGAADSVIQGYMSCYESLWRPCETEEECIGSGYCSDRPYTSSVLSYDYPIQLQIGSCFASGEYFGDLIVHCNNAETYLGVGCWNPLPTNESECLPFYGTFIYQNWVVPATTESECLQETQGRYGCLIPGPLDNLLWIMDPVECDCWGGTSKFAWEWTPGYWRGGVPRTFEWKQASPEPLYQLQTRLSFLDFNDWVKGNVLEKVLQVLRSEVLCTSNSITYPMFTLVCDCLSDHKGTQCYAVGNDEKEILMGFSYACHGENSTIHHPSAQIDFSADSVTQGCTLVNISIIYQNSYSAPFIPPPVSFEWEEQKDKGVVINQQHQSTVGELVGDGCSLSFTDTQDLGIFEICLRVSSLNSTYPVGDFGYLLELDSEWIYPLGVDVTLVERFSSIFYCASVNYSSVPSKEEGVVRLFAINRLENYEKENDEYVSKQTKILMYFLGVCYCLLVPLLLLDVQRFLTSRGRKTALLSLWLSVCFILVCIFRAVFMFLYPAGKFENNSLAEFVIFEIPTFLLLSVVIICIYYWKKVTIKRHSFFSESNQGFIIYIGLGLVWSIWVIVTVVYAEVILEENASSPCGGRVPVDYSTIEEDTRILAITYQSIIIAVTVLLTLLYLYYSYRLFETTKRISGAKQFVTVLGGIICSAFILRCILFLILLAIELSSSIYLFITLMITEVLMMVAIQVQFFKRQGHQKSSSSSTDTRESSTLPSQFNRGT